MHGVGEYIQQYSHTSITRGNTVQSLRQPLDKRTPEESACVRQVGGGGSPLRGESCVYVRTRSTQMYTLRECIRPKEKEGGLY